MSKLIFEFPNDKIRDKFLSQFCDGGIENDAYDAMAMQNIACSFDYKKAFPAWGWNGKGDPTIIVKTGE